MQFRFLTRYLSLGILSLAFFLPVTSLEAHSPDQSYIYLRVYKDAIGGRFEMTAKDLNKALGLSLPDRLSVADLQPHLTAIQNYFRERSAFRGGSENYTLNYNGLTVLPLDEMEDFAQFHFDLVGVREVPDELDITFTPLFDRDKKHRGVLIMEHNWELGIFENEALIANIYGPGNPQQSLSLKESSIWKGFVALVKLGIWHIWIGLDHILFIIALILPAVVRRRKEDEVLPSGEVAKAGSWAPVSDFKSAFLYILKIVTFFTIAHSITLALASLGIIELPSRLVESIIAVSIALAAYHNIQPIFKSKEWLVAFAFGLFHGFGFASVLGEKGLGGDYMVYSLLGFNVGVEIGQVFIICLAFPVLFLIRRQKFYPQFITYGSALLIFIAMYWTIERGFDVDLQLGAYFWKAYSAVFG